MKQTDLYSKNIFTKESLPSTRKEVFKDVLHLHYFSLIKIGLILVGFLIPYAILNFVKDYSYIYANEFNISNFLVVFLVGILKIPALMFLSIGISGLFKIFKDYAWLEPVFFIEDFKKSVKQNGRFTMISMIFIGLLSLIFEVCKFFDKTGWFTAIPFGFNLVVLFPILFHTIYLNCMYTNKYKINFKLGCYLYYKHLPTTILFSVLILVFKLYDLIHMANIVALVFKYFILLVFFVFVFPMILLANTLNEFRIFDIEINSTRFPQIVDKGLTKNPSNKK